jgi:division protein CdvB (Snf7/Vps24/ESCRT-III family)
MSKLGEDKFKLALATDLILFMIEVWTHKTEDREDAVKLLIDTWSKRVDDSARKLQTKYAKTLAESEDNLDEYFTEDIAMIMLEVNSIRNIMMKNEFTDQIQKAIFERLEKLKQ